MSAKKWTQTEVRALLEANQDKMKFSIEIPDEANKFRSYLSRISKELRRGYASRTKEKYLFIYRI